MTVPSIAERVKVRVSVWDVPTRITHWLMVLLFAVSWWTGKGGRLEWHRWSGYALLGLLAFRIFWAFFGSSTARFAQFLRGPREVVAYLKGRWTLAPGHNPLGALSVLAMLLLLLAQVGFGLFAVDVDGIESGPLSRFVSFETGRVCAEWHEHVFDALLWIIGLHVVAVLYYVFVKKENLVGAMFSGRRAYAEQPAEPVRFASVARFIAGAVTAAAITWILARE
jgi:cytochrome b